MFHSVGRLLLALARFPALNAPKAAKFIRYEGLEHYYHAKREGHGVLIATAHLGNWELSAYAHALLRAPMNVVVRPLDNPLIDRLVELRRALSGNRPIFKKRVPLTSTSRLVSCTIYDSSRRARGRPPE